MPAPVPALLIGIGAGVVSGVFGVGGGIVVVPALVIAFRFSQTRAAATSTAVIVVAAGAALIPFSVAGAVRWDLAGWLLCGSLAGAYFGARTLDRVSETTLRYFFAGFLALMAGWMIAG